MLPLTAARGLYIPMNITSLTPSQLRQAANLKETIASLEKELGQLLGSNAALVVVKPAVRKKGGMSAAGKARIVAAQKAGGLKLKRVNPRFLKLNRPSNLLPANLPGRNSR